MNGVANSDKYKSEKHGSSQHSDSDDTANHIEFRAATYNWSQAFFTMMRINFLTVLRLPRQIVTTVIVPIILIVITFYLLTIPTSIDDAINKVQLGFSMYPNYNVVVVTSDGMFVPIM